MKYLFILGRNVELSLAEVFSYFEKEGNEILNYGIEKNSILLDLENPIENVIDNFGGVISIGEVLCEGDEKELISCLERQELYMGKKNKFNYCFWNFADESIEEISIYLKKRFRSEKLKATQKTLNDKIELQSGGKAQKITSKLINEEFFLFGEDNLYFGKITQKCDYEGLEKRDMSRPVRRESLSISPRLAKIMINLSQVKKNGKLLDSFCGVGVILQEALLQEIEVVGIDKDKKAINGARQNLEYQNFSAENYKLINWDSSTAKINEVNVLVTEPDLGETLKKIPTKEKAQKMLKNYENLMIKVLGNLSNLVLGKIVFTAPFIRIGKKRLSCDIEKILENTDLKLSIVKDIKFPIPEFRGNQIVGREIFVLD
jgi:tRNA G10  N-methylase Trm11